MNAHTEMISAAVHEVLAELAPGATRAFKPGDSLRRDVGLDSLQSMELLSRLTERFDIDPEMDEVMDIDTLGDVVTFLAQHVPAAA